MSGCRKQLGTVHFEPSLVEVFTGAFRRSDYLESPDHSWKWSIMLVIALVAMVIGHQGGGPSEQHSTEQSPRLLSATIVSALVWVRGLGRGVGFGLGTGAASAFSEESAAGLAS